jgi:TetR/AcrR family tetracycline transcriptional repressor
VTAPSKRRRPGPRRALAEDEILDATLQLLDEGGANGMSIRGIAAKVGVAPNAVYTYFPDKAAVIRAMVDRLFGEIDHGIFADRALPWRQRVESLAVELRARLAAHPGAVALMIGQPRIGPHALALGERLLELFTDAGLALIDAARASHLLFGYVYSSVALDVADLNQPGAPSMEERIATRHQAFAAAPAGQFPRVVAAAATMASVISTEQYLWGLGRLLDGITTSQGADPEPAAASVDNPHPRGL